MAVPPDAGTARVSIRLQVVAGGLLELDADRDLAVARVELGEVGVGIADGGDPDRFGDGFRRDAVAGGLVQAGHDADLRPVERRRWPPTFAKPGSRRIAASRQATASLERASVIAHDGDRQLALAALVDVPGADVRNIGQTPGDFAFDLLLREFARRSWASA